MRDIKSWGPMMISGGGILLASQFSALPETPSWWPSSAIDMPTAAHLGLYAALGLFVARYLSLSKSLKTMDVMVFTASLCLSCGVFDEIHQMYVDGRTAEFSDLVSDLAGAGIGCSLYLVVNHLSRCLGRWIAEKGMIPVAVRAGGALAILVFIVLPAVQHFRIFAPAVASAASGPSLSLKKTLADLFGLRFSIRDHSGNNVPEKLALEKKGHGPQPPAQEPVVFTSIGGTAEPETKSATLFSDAPAERTVDVPEKSSFVLTAHAGAVDNHVGTVKKLRVMAVNNHRSNPVTQLSLSDIRKLLTGRYTNWKQVGGEDFPVKVITGHDGPDIAQLLFKVPVAEEAACLPFMSLVIPCVSCLKSAVGFLAIRDLEQLGVVSAQQGIKLISIKCEAQSPAVTLTRMSLCDGSYPLRFLP